MVLQVNYRTENGEIQAAQAQEAGLNGASPPLNQSEVRVLRTAAGLDLLVSAVLGGDQLAENQGHALHVLREQIFLRCQESIETDPIVILRDAIQSAIQSARRHPLLKGFDVSILIAAIYGNHLYLAHTGQTYAYLVRDERLVSLTRDSQSSYSIMNLSKTLPVGVSNRYSGAAADVHRTRKRDTYVDANIHIPGQVARESLDLQPRDGLILSTDRSIEKVIHTDGDSHLSKDFLSLYDEQPASVIADRLIQASSGLHGNSQPSLIVVKTNDALAAFPISVPVRGGSCLSQIGVIALILIVSMGLGLIAAYAVPALMNPKPIPNTGPNVPPPSGFISILMADGVAQANVPGQGQVILAPGAVLNAKPNTVVETSRGTSKLQMIDGTNVYVGNNTSLLFQKLADPKVNLLDTQLVLSKGTSILDASHSNKTSTTVNIPSPDQAQITGLFVGVQYLPDLHQVYVGCMEGECSLVTSGGKETLQTGQALTMTKGNVGGIVPLDMSIWQSLCDTECPAPAPQGLPTPTDQPSATPQPTPVPYLGGVLPTQGIINPGPVISVFGGDPAPVSVAPNPTATATAPPAVTTISPPPPTGAPPPKVVRARNLPMTMLLIMAMVMVRVRGAARIQKKGNHNSGVED